MTPYYADDSVTIYHGDCREWMPEADVIVTDPPYGISLNNDWQDQVHSSAPNRGRGAIVNDNGEIDPVELCAGYRNRIVFGFPYLTDMAATGWLVWDKEPGFQGRSLTSPVEMAYSTTWRGFKAVRVLWSGYMRAPGSEPRETHPTQKPLAVMRYVLTLAPDGVVLDPFMGTGSTLRAAKDLGRHAIGIEIEERYCEIAARRCSQEVLGLTA
jgi:site-specific DNA-methyltransferase (adenine-specific)